MKIFTKRIRGGKIIAGNTIHEYKIFKVSSPTIIELSHSLYYTPNVMIIKGDKDKLIIKKVDRRKITLEYKGDKEEEYEILIY